MRELVFFLVDLCKYVFGKIKRSVYCRFVLGGCFRKIKHHNGINGHSGCRNGHGPGCRLPVLLSATLLHLAGPDFFQMEVVGPLFLILRC